MKKYKFILFMNIIYLYLKNIKILFNFTNIDYYLKRDSNYFFNFYLNLKKLGLYKTFFLKNRYKIIQKFSNNTKNTSTINKIYLSSRCRFGNCIFYLNKVMSYCEILGCKYILLNKKYFWFIKNSIILKNKIEIKLSNRKNLKDAYKYGINYHNFFGIKTEIKINEIRNEIINNLPKIKIFKNDLYIHIRSEDIFKIKKIKIEYIQPPLCFYKSILNNFKFQNIYIISSDNLNPVINKLISYFPTIINNKNNLKYDISILLNAYNLVGSTSSFFLSILQLNNNIKFLWDYNIYDMRLKNIHSHYDLYKYIHKNIIIYRMEPSNIYKNVIFYWENNKRQLKLILKEKCYNNFRIIDYNAE